jgi:hypothetical protein
MEVPMRRSAALVPLIAVALTFAAGPTRAQTVRNVAVPVKVSDAAANALIAKQWASRGWSSFSGSVAGCSYTLAVPAPTVDFDPGLARLNLSLTVSSTNCGGGPWSVAITPRLSIPSGQLTTARVRMWLSDLYTLIDGLPVPTWVKDALRNQLGTRWGIPGPDNLDAFPAALLSGLTSPWFDQRSVNLSTANPFQFAWQVNAGSLQLTPSVNIQAGQGATVSPDFKSRLFLASNTDWIDFWSNIKAKVRTVRVFTLAGGPLYTANPTNVSTIKYHGNPSTEWIMIDLQGTLLNFNQVYIVWVLFETDDTFYSREYKLVSNNSSGWTFSVGGYN